MKNEQYDKIKNNHTCKGERYLTDCKACWCNRMELQGVPKKAIIELLKENDDKKG